MKRVLAVLGVLGVLVPAHGFAASCIPTDTRLCLQGGLYQVEVTWTVPGWGQGPGHAVPQTQDTGTFWFFDNSNVELVLKVLDGRPANGHFWVYYGGLSDVAYTVTVTDVVTGARKAYENPAGQLVSRADTEAFATAKLSPDLGGGGDPLPPSPLLREGAEFPVNLTTRNVQRHPSVAIGPDGGFMVVWWDETEEFAIRARLFDTGGRPRLSEIRVSEGAFPFWPPRVAASATGEYMVVWIEGGKQLLARVFEADGRPLAAPFVVDDQFQGSAWVEPGSAGGFQVLWSDAALARTQAFSPRGERVGEEHRFPTPMPPSSYGSRLAASPAGGHVITWAQQSGPVQSDVWARRLDHLGRAVGAPFQVSASGGVLQPAWNSDPVPVFHAGGGFSIVWTSFVFPASPPSPATPGLYARRFDAAGQPVGDPALLRGDFSVSETAPAVAALRADEILVVWHQLGLPEDPSGGLFGQVFGDSWEPRSAATRINTYTTNSQIEPVLAVDGRGGVVAAWTSGIDHPAFDPVPPDWGEGTQDGHLLGIFGQRFTLQTCAVYPTQLCLGGRFQVEVFFTDPRDGKPGTAFPIPLTGDTGAFWFFGAENVELVLKVLDGRAVNGRFWVYYGALSDVRYTVAVTDTVTGRRKTYRNPRGRLASRADIEAF